MHKFLLIFLIGFLMSNALMGQAKKANLLYKKLGYMSAADYYQDLSEDKQNYEVKLNLANSFRLNGEYESAEYWYAQIVKEANDNDVALQYAQVLQINGKCEDAIRWYNEYTKKSGDKNRSFIENCEETAQFKYHQNILVKNQSALNSEYHDFSPIPYDGGLIFTSMRSTNKLSADELDHWTNVGFSDLYYASKKNNAYEAPKELKGAINGIYHDGVATFNPAKKEMIFTRNPKKEKGSDGIKRLQLYSASGAGHEWKDAKALSINGKDFSTAHPTLSSDKQRLYFASDRPGGFGGMDIYISTRTGNDWSEPYNLGPTVNTSGNEIFPFISKSEKLFFASDGHKGIGGLDIFMVEKTEKTNERSWDNRKNVGSPINSEKDDFGFYIDANEESGFLSSNRTGGAGADDIYSWAIDDGTNKENPFQSTTHNCATCIHHEGSNSTSKIAKVAFCDETTGARLSDVKVAILKDGQSWINSAVSANPSSMLVGTKAEGYGVKLNGGLVRADASFLSNQDGNVLYVFNPEKQYAIYSEKDAYFPNQTLVSLSQLQNNEAYCIPLKQRACIPFEAIVKNKKFDKAIPNAEVTIIDQCSGERIKLITGYDGKISTCLSCNCEFELIVRKVDFHEAWTNINTQDMACSTEHPLKEVLYLQLEQWNPKNGPVSTEYINEYFTGDAEGHYKVGDVLTLKHIYYDFDKYHIRSDAQYELDYLVTLMKNYPSMEILLSSHTDSRGTKDYNTWLSRKRAKSARQYLYDKGIDAYRISGYEAKGEADLTNPCGDGVDCSEEEHQENRRTEITITRIDESVQINHSRRR